MSEQPGSKHVTDEKGEDVELVDDPGAEGRDNPAGPEREGHEEDEGGSA